MLTWYGKGGHTINFGSVDISDLYINSGYTLIQHQEISMDHREVHDG